MLNNWFMTDYSSPMIAIAYCKEKPGQAPGWCKTKDETDEWLAMHQQYFV